MIHFLISNIIEKTSENFHFNINFILLDSYFKHELFSLINNLVVKTEDFFLFHRFFDCLD